VLAERIELAVLAVQLPTEAVELAVSILELPSNGVELAVSIPQLPSNGVELAVSILQLPSNGVELTLQHVVRALEARLRVRARAQRRPSELLDLFRCHLRFFELLAQRLDLLLRRLLCSARAGGERRPTILRSSEALAQSLHLRRFLCLSHLDLFRCKLRPHLDLFRCHLRF
jgi:hypothetical protein